MRTHHLKTAAATAVAIGLGLAGQAAQAATWQSVQDTYVYEFLGNQGAPSGDSGGILVWNHESSHGAQGLLQIDSGWTTDAALSGSYTATLNLYSSCTPGGFVGACIGDDGTSSTTDVVLQAAGWDETDAGLSWSDISQSSSPSASFTQTSNADGWISVDVTSLIAEMLSSSIDYGFVLTQEAYGVTRTSANSLAVSSFCDSESTSAACAAGSFSPYLEISSVSAVPVPAAVWLFGSGLIGLMTVARRRTGSLTA